MTKKSILLIVLALTLAACAAEPPPPPTATEAPTSTPMPTRTPTLAPVLVFEDTFDGALAEGWTWMREDSERWSLEDAPGRVRIYVSSGGLNGGFPNNLLVYPAPEGDFAIETMMEFEPFINFQIAGLLVYADEQNAMQFGRAFCDVPGPCVGNGLYFDSIVKGKGGENNFAMNAPDPSKVYLKLEKKGAAYHAYYSEDGASWKEMGTQTSAMTPVYVGLIAAQGPEEELWPADFDYFRLYAQP